MKSIWLGLRYGEGQTVATRVRRPAECIAASASYPLRRSQSEGISRSIARFCRIPRLSGLNSQPANS
jgi:hypothetical protein